MPVRYRYSTGPGPRTWRRLDPDPVADTTPAQPAVEAPAAPAPADPAAEPTPRATPTLRMGAW